MRATNRSPCFRGERNQNHSADAIKAKTSHLRAARKLISRNESRRSRAFSRGIDTRGCRATDAKSRSDAGDTFRM